MALIREGQQITVLLGRFLEIKGYNKAAVARKANMDPDDLYAMLGNRKIMTADSYVDLCNAIETNTDEIIKTVSQVGLEYPPTNTDRPA